MSVVYSGDKITFADSSVQSSAPIGFKNRIINGDFRIDQRNAGASVTPATGDYTLDRWQSALSQAGKYTIQQNAASVTPPAGFVNYLGVTSSSAYSVISSDIFSIQQKIEGLNVADLGFGTANAKTVTVSFWVRSSLTGTFGGSLQNGAGNRSYPFTYTISSANTWEQKSITIAGDTTGTWLTTNGVGIRINFGLGVGSTSSGTAGAWAAADYRSATSAVSVVGTNGATFYITGVQLEVGSTASAFEVRDYGRELQMCQRYFCKSFDVATAPANGIAAGAINLPFPAYDTANGQAGPIKYPVSMRTTPTVTFYRSPSGATNGVWATYDGGWTSLTSVNTVSNATEGFGFSGSRSGAFTTKSCYLSEGQYTASAEL